MAEEDADLTATIDLRAENEMTNIDDKMPDKKGSDDEEEGTTCFK
jgi:hypothetical protein